MASKYYISPGTVVPKTELANNFSNRDEFDPIVQNIVETMILAGSGVNVFLQATTPTVGESTLGDVYININSGRIYQFDGAAWNSKYNPAVITENKSYAYSTYNKAETFTTGNTTATKTSGTDNLSIGTGDLGSGDVAYLRYNETGVATHFTVMSVKDGQAAIFSTDDITDHYTAAVAMPSAYNISYVDAGDATKAASINVTVGAIEVETLWLNASTIPDINFAALPVYADNTAAAALVTGRLYQTATGELRIKV